MAANVDLLVTVTSLANPAPRPITLDQLLAFAELEEIAAAVVLTKPDLAEPAGCEDLAGIYRALEYPTIVVNPKTRGDRAAPRADCAAATPCWPATRASERAPSSGRWAGTRRCGEVSRHGLGRQTTSAGRLYRLAGGLPHR